MWPHHDTLATALEVDEGRKHRAYPDTATPPRKTIGVGCNITDVPFTIEERSLLAEQRVQRILAGDEPLTDPEIDFLRDNRINREIANLDRNIPWWRNLSLARQVALMNMAYALGWPKLSKFVKMIDALRVGDYSAAAHESLNSKWADQTDGKEDGRAGDRAKRIFAALQAG